MSRYCLRSDQMYEVVVGYDDVLDSFFAQVYDVQAGERTGNDVLIVQTGMNPREITTAVTALDSVAAFANFTADLGRIWIAALEGDRASRREPTDFQRETAKRFDVDLP